MYAANVFVILSLGIHFKYTQIIPIYSPVLSNKALNFQCNRLHDTVALDQKLKLCQ